MYKANSAKNVDLSNQLSKLKVGKEEPETDKTFRSFKKRVAKDPEQVNNMIIKNSIIIQLVKHCRLLGSSQEACLF